MEDSANPPELLAAYWTLAGDRRPFDPQGVISPFPFAERVEAAAAAGWKGIGLLSTLR